MKPFREVFLSKESAANTRVVNNFLRIMISFFLECEKIIDIINII